MKVALDGTPLTLTSGGLHRYTAELSRALAECFPQDEFALASDQPFEIPGPQLANLTRLPGPRNPLERRWWAWGLNRALDRAGADVFHGTNFEAPYHARRAAVLTLHDLSPWMEAWSSDASARVRRRTPALLRAGSATLVVTPTEAVRRQAIGHFGLAPDKVIAVPEAAAAFIKPVETSVSRPYFLYAGAIGRRKNLQVLLDAWREVRRDFPVDLVLAGRRCAGFPEFPPEPGLRVSGEVPDHELAALYSGALAFLYPSLYEGFGLPVLEAMQCGAAVIASRDAAIAEVAGDAAVLADARDVRAWVEAMRMVAVCPERVAGMRANSLARAREFSWARTARMMREVYEDARRRFGR
jgi:glycosyltransferase involved in cell wall biosynthesis